MTNPTELRLGQDSAEARAAKYRQLNAVLEGCFDLLNDDITGEAWLGQLAELADCHTVGFIWWRAHLPETYGANVYGKLDDDARDWVDYLEPALAAARHDDTRLIEGLTGSDRMLRPDRMVYCVEHSQVRAVFVFSHHKHQDAWNDDDKKRLLRVMKILEKPLRVRCRQSLLTDVLDLANKFIDAMPWALLILTPDAEVFATNAFAKKLIENGEVMQVRNNKLRLVDRAKDAELSEELGKVLRLPSDEIDDYVWYRNLSDSTEPGSCMLTMLCFPFTNWKLESTACDRVVVMVIQIMDQLEVPTVSQLGEFYKLTRSQCNVVSQLLEGHSIETTAGNLHVSINTVRTHLRAIYAKLGVDNKTQLLQRIASTINGPKEI